MSPPSSQQNSRIQELEERLAELENRSGSLELPLRLLEVFPEAVIGAGPELRVTFWNPAAEELFGVAPEEAAGRALEELLGRNAAGPVWSAFRSELLSAGAADLELPLARPGEEPWLALVSARAVNRDADGVEGFLIHVRKAAALRGNAAAQEGDLRRLRDELAFQTSHRSAELQAIIDALTDPFLIYNREGITVRANQSAREILGFDPTGQALEANLGSMYDWHSGDRPLALEDLPSSRALRGERTNDMLVCFRNREGKEYYVQASASPILVEKELVGAVSLWRDVTVQMRSELELRRAHERLQVVLDTLPVAVWIAGPDGQIIAKNRSVDMVWGGDAPLPEEITGYRVYQGWWADTGAELEAQDWALARALQSGETSTGEMIDIRRFDGSMGTILNGAAPILDEKGRISGAVAVSADITHQRQLERELSAMADLANRRAAELRSIFDAMIEAVVVYDRDGKVIHANRSAVKDYGFALPGQDEAPRPLPVRTLEGRPVYLEELTSSRVLQGESVHDQRFRFRDAEGQERVAVAGAYPLNVGGELAGAVVVWHDITRQEQLSAENERQQALLQHQRRRLELALHETRQSQEKLAGILESIQDGFIALDSEWRFTYANQLAVNLSDLPEAEVLGRHLWEVFPELRGTLVEDYYEQVRGTGSPVQFRFASPDNGRWYDVSVYPSNEGISIYFVDRTEQIQTEAALRESELRFRTLVESMDDFVFTLDREGRYTGMYGRAIWSSDEIEGRFLGRTAEEVFGPEAGAVPSDANRRSLAGEQVTYVWDRVLPSGRVYYQIRLSPLRNSEGEVIGSVGVGRDFTPMKQAEAELRLATEKLQRSNRELEEFAFVASHDLQEPLRKIEAFGERLKERMQHRLNETEALFLERMMAASTRMQAMINGLLAYSRITTKARPFARVDLEQIAQEVLQDLEARLEQVGGRVEVGSLPVIEADPVQMRQMFQNLIGNALKFHKPGEKPLVRVSSRALDIGPLPGIEIRVEDNGIGFDLKHLERIFKPFERLTGRSEYEGSGMGLAICHKIAERHGGSITAESQPGEGTTFRVLLPVRQQPDWQENGSTQRKE